MMTMSGNRMAMVMHPPTYHLANVNPPKLSDEEEKARKQMLAEVRRYEKDNLHKCETDDRSAPLVSGKVATPGGWKDAGPSDSAQQILNVKLNPTRGKGPHGIPGKGKGGLGDLFSGGFRPNPGALKSTGRGAGGQK